MGDNSNLRTHRCSERPNGYGIRYLNTRYRQGWHLMRHEFDWDWDANLYLPVAKISWCPFCGKKMVEAALPPQGGKGMTELLPCPFCGSPAAIEEYDYYDDGPDYSVQCTNVTCACSGPYRFDRTKEEAVQRWNTRDGCQICRFGAKPMTEDNMRELGWVRERTCYDTREFGDFTCSVCGCVVRDTADENPTVSLNGRYADLNYCPCCGAKVVEE